jgi:hypothetical protein
VRTLDVVAARGNPERFADCDFDIADYLPAVDAAWAAGGVLFAEEMCLFTPFDGLGGNRIADALARFAP